MIMHLHLHDANHVDYFLYLPPFSFCFPSYVVFLFILFVQARPDRQARAAVLYWVYKCSLCQPQIHSLLGTCTQMLTHGAPGNSTNECYCHCISTAFSLLLLCFFTHLRSFTELVTYDKLGGSHSPPLLPPFASPAADYYSAPLSQ